jgi:hypothetical protein
MTQTSGMLFCWFSFMAAFWAYRGDGAAQELPAAAVPPDVPQLIKQLGDGDFSVRERASDTLKQK